MVLVMLGSYSRVCGTVSDRPLAVRGQGVAVFLEAAVEAAAGATALGRERLDGGVRERGAERAVTAIERSKAALDIEALLDLGKAIDRLAEPGGKPIRLGDEFPASSAIAPGQHLVEGYRGGPDHLPLAPDLGGDARGVVPEDNARERAERAALRIEGRQPGNQIDQEVLADVVKLHPRQSHSPRQPSGCAIGFEKEEL
jgi:hypothetical protein